MAFCLPKEFAEKLETVLEKGDRGKDPKTGKSRGNDFADKLARMTPDARVKELERIVGKENSKQVNAEFESKLVLKNIKAGLIRWAETATKDKATKADILKKIEDLDTKFAEANKRALEEGGNKEGFDLNSFLESLVSKKLGLELTEADFKIVSQLTSEIQISRAKIEPQYLAIERSKVLREYQKTKKGKEVLQYGAERVLLDKYLEKLKFGENKGKPISEQVKTYLTDPRLMKRLLIDFGGITKTLVASLDISLFGRQGLTTLITNPTIWGRAFAKNIGIIKAELKGKKWIREEFKKEVKGYEELIDMLDFTASDIVRADIYARPNALNGIYDKGKLDVGIGFEEAIPSSIPGKLADVKIKGVGVPGVNLMGKLFRTSESSFSGGAMRMRADLMDRYVRIAKQNKVDIRDTAQVESLGKFVNAMTGRGHLEKSQVYAQEINVALFSLRWFKSNVDVLTAHQLQKGVTPFVRKQAALNLAKIVTATSVTLMMAEAMWPGSVEKDARSADFGKIKIGSTRFDISGGKSSIVTLAMRQLRGSTKSASTGKVYDLNTNKFGSKTRWDLFIQFAENKASPTGGAVRDFIRGYDFGGEKPTPTSLLKGLTVPISVQTAGELMDDPNSANFIMSMVLEELGISANTF